VSIDEAYLDITGTERLYGPPLRAAHLLHERMTAATSLNCSIGIACSRLVAKISSDQAKPNGVLWILPGREAAFLAPLDVRKVPGVGKVTEKNLHAFGIRKVGDLARLDEDFLAERFGKWGMALAGKSRGLDAGGWFDSEIGVDEGPKSISHEHTFGEDTADPEHLDATLARLSEMVGRRLREHGLQARTIQLKLRYSDFSTITRAHSIARATELDTEIFEEVRDLFRRNWKAGATVRLLGVQLSGWAEGAEQMDLLNEDRHEKWRQTMAAADRLRDKFGDSAISLGTSLRGSFRERTHENPAGLPGKHKPK
jgi:DNA polymerase-4